MVFSKLSDELNLITPIPTVTGSSNKYLNTISLMPCSNSLKFYNFNKSLTKYINENSYPL